MGAVAATAVKLTEFSGDYKIGVFTITPAAASDTVDLSSYFSEIVGAMGHITAGLDANLTLLQVSYSGTTITVKQLKADGATNASDWTSAEIELIVIGKCAANSA